MRWQRRKGRAVAGAERGTCVLSDRSARSKSVMHPRAIWAIGCGQLVNWGVLFFAFSVLLVPLQDAFEAPRWLVAGAFSLGLLVSAIAAPAVGRLVDRGQGPAVMRAGGLLAAGLLILWALVPTIWMTYIVWAALGLCMASILYEPVFAMVGRAFADPEGRLRAIATVTVTGGLASTAFLPGTSALVDALRLARRRRRARDHHRRDDAHRQPVCVSRPGVVGANDSRCDHRTGRFAPRQRATARHRPDGRALRDLDHRQLRRVVEPGRVAHRSRTGADVCGDGRRHRSASCSCPGRLLLSNARIAPQPVPLLIASFALQIAGLLALDRSWADRDVDRRDRVCGRNRTDDARAAVPGAPRIRRRARGLRERRDRARAAACARRGARCGRGDRQRLPDMGLFLGCL